MNVKSGICSLSRSHSRMFSVSLFLFRQWISVPLLATKNAQMRLSIQRCKKIVATTLIDLPRFGAFSSVLCWPIHLCFRSISFNLFIKLWIYIVNFRKLPPTKAPKASGFVCVCVFLNARFHPLNWLLGLLVFKSQASTVTGCCQDLTITSAQQQLDLTTGKFSLRIAAKAWVFPGRVIREMVLGKHASCLITSSTLTFFFGGSTKTATKLSCPLCFGWSSLQKYISFESNFGVPARKRVRKVPGRSSKRWYIGTPSWSASKPKEK